jgi:hypothetical protein
MRKEKLISSQGFDDESNRFFPILAPELATSRQRRKYNRSRHHRCRNQQTVLEIGCMQILSRLSVGRTITPISVAIVFGCAQGTIAPSSLGTEVTLPAGSGRLVTSHISEHREVLLTYSRASSGDTTEHLSVRTIVEEHPTEVAGAPAVLMIRAGHYGAGDFTDSLLVRREGLVPICEHLRYPQMRYEKHIDFTGDQLRQTNHLGDSTRTFEMHFALPVFAFSEIDLLIRSLPFSNGYHAIVPLYSEGDDSLEMDTVTVTGPIDHQWSVRFGDAVIVATYGIDSASRQIERYDLVNRRSRGRVRRVRETTP